MAIMVIKASSAGLGDGNVLQLITDVEFSFHSFVVEIIDVSMILLSRDDSSKLEGWFKGSKMNGLARRLVNSSSAKICCNNEIYSKTSNFSSLHFVRSEQKFWPEGSAQEHIGKYHNVRI